MAEQARWRTGQPPEHGYYLGAWKTPGGRWVVSELWFNPDSIGSGWWASRGYLHQPHTFTTVPVVAWIPMPEYEPPLDTGDAKEETGGSEG